MVDERPRPTSHARVTFLARRAGARAHELISQRAVAEHLAAVMGCSFDDFDHDEALPAALGYVVPSETIESLEAARALGVADETGLFGGVVPHPFVATKTITHPLVAAHAAAPEGWQAEFARRVGAVVLPGFSAFSAADARAAGRLLLRDGDVRVKLASAAGGQGQTVARDAAELDARIDAIDPAAFARDGVVIERNLARVRTHSVGMIRVGSLRASYFGIQKTTRSRHCKEVYGGSSLTVVRGGLDALDRRALEPGVRRAIAQARTYHEAALACFAGMFASRCNYDVAEGEDAAGRAFSGVLEQSWRIGGASGAEVAALQAFTADASIGSVRASTVEVHAADVDVPAGATVYFSGVDELLGPLTKYALVEHADGHARAED